jgi:hypothetical protein
LSQRGRFYFILTAANRPEELRQQFRDEWQMDSEVGTIQQSFDLTTIT